MAQSVVIGPLLKVRIVN